MELRHLRYFVAVAEERSFRRASLRLNISQPPLTRQIQQLEEEFGFALFERYSTGVTLTAAGACFLDEARRILRLSCTAVEKARDIAEGRGGRLEVAFYGSVIFKILPAIISEFRTLAPNVSIGITNLQKDAQVRALNEGWLDIGFARFYREEPGLRSELVCVERIVLAVAATNPLAQRGEVSLAELCDCQFVVFPRSPRPSFADEVTRLAEQAGFSINIAHEAEDLVACLALVSVDIGIALVPSSAERVGIRNVVFVSVINPVPTSSLLCITRAADTSALLEIFLNVTRKLYR